MSLTNVDRPILITGCARSGTSWVARLIDTAGAFGGKTAGPNRNNRKGMFENVAIRNTIIKPYLREQGWDPLGQHPLPVRSKCHHQAKDLGPQWRSRFMSIMLSHGYRSGPIYYKGAKMCLVWPIWHWAFPNARWIIVRRADDGIIDSCLRTNFMRAFQGRQGWQRWIDEHKRCFREMEAGGLDIVSVWTDKLAHGDTDELKKAIAHCGLTLDLTPELLDPSLFTVTQGVVHAK